MRICKIFHQGDADLTAPDILVKTSSINSFYIDAKRSPAQCGQFVLLPDLEAGTFEYSRLNVNRTNSYAEMIINYMNDDFDAFREADTAGKILICQTDSISSPTGLSRHTKIREPTFLSQITILFYLLGVSENISMQQLNIE